MKNKIIPNLVKAKYDGFCKMCGIEILKDETMISSWGKNIYFCANCHKKILIEEFVIPYLRMK